MTKFTDDWRNYVPPTADSRAPLAPEKAADRRNTQRQQALEGHASSGEANVPVRANDGTSGRPGVRSTQRAHAGGRARITSNVIVWVDAERRLILEGDVAQACKAKGWNLERLHSKREARRYLFLLNEQDNGRIGGLRRQVRFALNVARPDGLVETIAHWTCDFEYFDVTAYSSRTSNSGLPTAALPGERVIEDCKGHRTEMYIRSKKHFEAQYGLSILET